MSEIQHFIRFLKEHDILYTFFDAFTEIKIMNEKNAPYQNPIKVIEENYEITKDFIAQAFAWYKTKQGAVFWLKINNKFVCWWKNNVEYRVK